MANNFHKAERYVKQDGEYKLLSYATSSESVEMTDGTDLQTKADSIDKAISDETTRAKNAESDLNLKKIDKTTVATSSALGLVKSGTDITVDTSGNVSVNDNSHNHTVSNISDLTATASELNVLDGITATTIELNYTDGVTSNIQTQLDGKSTNGHTHDDRYYTETEIDTKLNAKLNTSLKGSVNGLAELDENGKVPSSQLPSYVDDVIEGYYYSSNFYRDSSHTTEITGETGKIYIDLITNKTYRWSGSAFVVISETLALGETSSTAYRGDRGKIAYDHSQTAHAPSNAQANQNAFSNVLVGSTTIAANTTTDTLTLVAGSNITITPDATNNKISISSTGSDTDTKVTQTITTSDASYPLLLAPTGQTATTTTTSYFATKFQANPSTGEFTAPNLIGTTGVYATKYYGTTDAEQAFIFNGYCGGKRNTADILKVSGSSADGTTNTLNINTDLDDISFTKPMYVNNTFTATTVKSFGDVIANYGTDKQVSLQGLKDTTTQIRGKSIFSINNYGAGASKTGSSVSLWKDSATLTHGFYIAIISAVISTNTGTSRIELLANGNALVTARTNSTTYERVLAVHNFGVSGEQSFNFELVAKSQDASSTVTVPGYRTYSVSIFKIG
jgi:hypothetical protein